MFVASSLLNICLLSAHSPLLMHAILAVTTAEERYQASKSIGYKAAPQTYHELQCAKILNRKLSQKILPQERDPLWATATFLGVLSVTSVDATIPEEVWPLRPSSPSDLSWLRMSEGKMSLYRLVDPIRPGSIFYRLSDYFDQLMAPLPSEGLEDIPFDILQLCQLDLHSTKDNNPYFTAAHALSRVRRIPNSEMNAPMAYVFIHNMQFYFKTLLGQKDPIALILMGLWYTKARLASWSISCRATIESKSILLYLHKYHGGNLNIRKVLSLLESEVATMEILEIDATNQFISSSSMVRRIENKTSSV
jgi:hypothetical protein